MRKYLFGIIAALAFAAPAQAATAYLVSSWFQGGSQMCQYNNGTVLNVGSRTCPTTIQS